MKGQIQKKVESSGLACFQCAYFRDDDPDLFYCTKQRSEFPDLCEQYLSKVAITELKNKWNTL